MKEPEITCDWIDRYNDEDLKDKDKLVFEKRMLDNPFLRSEVEIDANLNRFLRDKDLMDLMDQITAASTKNAKGGRHFNYLLLAASVLCLVLIGGLFYLIRSTAKPSMLCAVQHPGHRVQSMYEEKPEGMKGMQKILSQGHDCSFEHSHLINTDFNEKEFKPLAEFDLLTGSATRANQFKLIRPDVNTCIASGTEVLFAWRDCSRNGSLFLVMMNNQGIPIMEIPLHRARYYTLKTAGMRRGLYYWKILEDDDLIIMGKLILN